MLVRLFPQTRARLARNFNRLIFPDRPPPISVRTPHVLSIATARLLNAVLADEAPPPPVDDIAHAVEIDAVFERLLLDYDNGVPQSIEEKKLARALAYVRDNHIAETGETS